MTNIVPVLMPKLTMAATEAIFMEWLVEDGHHVDEEQPIYLVATDKVESEVPSPASGILRHGDVEAEEEYEVGTEIGKIEVTADA